MNKLSWYWKLYCALLLCAAFVQMFRKMLTDSGGASARYSSVVVASVIVFVLIAKANEEALGKQWMWQSLFVVLAIGFCTLLGFGVYLGIAGVYFSAVLLSLGAVLIAPAIAEIFIYSYKSPHIWSWKSENSATTSEQE